MEMTTSDGHNWEGRGGKGITIANKIKIKKDKGD